MKIPAISIPKMPSMKEMAIILIFMQSLMGMFFMVYSSMYSVVDLPKAQKMIAFIKTENPDYYALLASNEDRSYLKEFYENYKIRGNRGLYFTGILCIAMAVNITIPLIYITTMDFIKKKKALAEQPELTLEDGEGTPPEGKEENKPEEFNSGNDF